MKEQQITNISVSAVAWQEGELWIAQGIEYDIVARSADIGSLPRAFSKAVVENACISVHLGREPLQGIKQAPPKYREMYEQAETALSSIRSPTIAPQINPSIDIRVAQPAA